MTLSHFSQLLTLWPRRPRFDRNGAHTFRRHAAFPLPIASATTPRHRSLPRVEGLEGRQLLSHTVTSMLPENAVAGRAANSNLVYTWHETDGQDVVGSMKVKRATLAAHKIPFADLVSFSFSIPFLGTTETFKKSAIERQTFPIPISKGTGNFKSPYATEGPGAAIGVLSIIIPANALSMGAPGSTWEAGEPTARPPCDQGRGILVSRRLKKERFAHDEITPFSISATGCWCALILL